VVQAIAIAAAVQSSACERGNAVGLTSIIDRGQLFYYDNCKGRYTRAEMTGLNGR